MDQIISNKEKKSSVIHPGVEPDWQLVREAFQLAPGYLHLGSSQFIAAHPARVREAIDRYRQALDCQPVLYTQKYEEEYQEKVREKVAEYMGLADPGQVALTQSATMGLGLVYTGLNIDRHHEVITGEHDHFSHHESIRQAVCRSGGFYKHVSFYNEPASATAEEIIGNLLSNITDMTRVLGLTWVHSHSGLKMPVSSIVREIRRINEGREPANRIIIVLDGVHGFGIELEDFETLGADFFITSTHKWLYGPRGTGFVAARPEAWKLLNPTIPSFSDIMDTVIEGEKRPPMDGRQMTPGGFQAFEYKWAMYEAFEWMMALGKEHIYRRVHQLNRICKEGLEKMPRVLVHTPMDDALSSGITSFEVEGMDTKDFVKKCVERKLIITAAPYKVSWARLTPGIINTEEEIAQGLEIIEDILRV